MSWYCFETATKVSGRTSAGEDKGLNVSLKMGRSFPRSGWGGELVKWGFSLTDIPTFNFWPTKTLVVGLGNL